MGLVRMTSRKSWARQRSRLRRNASMDDGIVGSMSVMPVMMSEARACRSTWGRWTFQARCSGWGKRVYDGANAPASGDYCCRFHRRGTGLGDTRSERGRHGGRIVNWVQVRDDTPQYARWSGCTALSQAHCASAVRARKSQQTLIQGYLNDPPANELRFTVDRWC